MKETLNVANPGDWDSAVSPHLIDEWAASVVEGITAESLCFQRGCTPGNPAKLPRLVGYVCCLDVVTRTPPAIQRISLLGTTGTRTMTSLYTPSTLC